MRLVCGDFRRQLPKLHGVRTFFTDPPYNLGFKYGPVSDRLPPQEYEGMIGDLARLTYQAAGRNANLFVVHYPEAIARLWPMLTKQWRFRQWITWCYPYLAGTSNRKWTRASRAVVWLTKGKPHGQSRTLPNWMVIPYVRSNSREYQGYSNQIPRELIRRCIQATTKAGELVADPCAGTGSTVKVAASLGRHGWGCDANPGAARYWKPAQEAMA